MNTDGWIDITEYAAKYRVSQSTLRRRIRGNTIAFRMDRGKYLLLDTPEALSKAPLFSRQQNIRPAKQHIQAQTEAWRSESWAQPAAPAAPQFQQSLSNPILEEEIKRLRTENKALREQLAEVETLVKVLEAELQPFNA